MEKQWCVRINCINWNIFALTYKITIIKLIFKIQIATFAAGMQIG